MARVSEFRPEGLGYVLTFPEVQTSFHVDRLRVSGGEFKGHVMVKTEFPGARTYAEGLVHYTQENLSSGASRRSMGKTLEDKIPSDPKLDWFGMYDEFCTAVMLADRKGSPADEVGDMPESSAIHRLLLSPLIPMGVHSILFGPGGLGKSIMAVAAAVSVETGKEVIPGFYPQETGPALYLNYETTREDIDLRVKAVCAGAGIKPVRMFHMAGGGRPLYTRVEAVARVIEQTGAVLLIIDSSGKAIGTTGEGPVEDGANRFATALDELARSTLCIDHISKASMGGISSGPYGSVMKSNWARATWELSQASRPDDDGTSHLVLHHRKHNTTAEHAPIALAMHWEGNAVTWTPDEMDEAAMRSTGSSTYERIIATLGDHPLRVKEIAAQIGTTEGTVRTEINRHKDRFRHLETNDWMLVP